MDDLSDVGLNALEALEAQDDQETSTDDNVEEKDTGSEEETSETSDNEAEDTGPEEEETSDEEETSEEEKSDPEDKKELSDEEFEELAKKRGYAKAPTEEEKASKDEEKATFDKLTSRPKEVSEEVWDNLPDENKIIYNSLPYINAVGKNGTLKIKTPDQLPDDFEFANQKEAMKFQNELQAQELKATQMSNALQERTRRGEAMEAQRAEARNVISQIEKLQKSGDLPTPKAKNGTKEFDDDPAVLLINKVLSYRAEKNREIGANLSIADSLMLYKASHPEDFAKKEAKGDIERKNIAKKVAGNSKSTGTAVNKEDNNKPQYYRVGMSTEDVLDRVLDEMD